MREENDPKISWASTDNQSGPKDDQSHLEKSASDKSFQCAKCSYAAKYKSALASHMMSHKTVSETTMYKCEVCQHETKRKADLRAHMIIHMDPADVKLFYCAHCPYWTRRKCDLKQHVIVHQTFLYQCPDCNFQTNNKLYLDKIHSLHHKDESEVTVYKCKFCLYETKFKNLFKRHKLIHQDQSQRMEYQCNWCNYKTKYKMQLKDHLLLLHTCPSEIKMYSCDMCEFQTKTKSGLKCHIQRKHMQKEMKYICAHCPFTTYRRGYIVKHLAKHQDPSRRKIYHCESCDFKSFFKGSVKGHSLTHIKKDNIQQREKFVNLVKEMVKSG